MNINIGGGDWVFPFWRNVDYYAKEEFIDYKINLEEDAILPFEDDSINLIYIGGCLTLLNSLDAVENTLNECYRVLNPNGMLRLHTCNEWIFRCRGNHHNHKMWLDPIVMFSLLYSCNFQKVFYMRAWRSHKPIFCLPLVFRNDCDEYYQLDVFKKYEGEK